MCMFVRVRGGVGLAGAGMEAELGGGKQRKNRAWHRRRHYCDNRWIAGKSSNFLFQSEAEGREKKQTERPNKERTGGKMKHNVLQRRDQISGKESSGNNENA